MTRLNWGIVAVAALVGACATGGDDSAAPGADAAGGGPSDGTTINADSTTGSSEGSPADDTGAPADDTGSGGDDSAIGVDANGVDANGVDANVADTSPGDSALPDASADSAKPDAGHDSGTADAGTDSGSTVDAGSDAGCSPVTPSFTKTYFPPFAQPLSCAASDVTNFYNACIAGSKSACTTWQNANPTCDTCLEGTQNPAGPDWGPFTAWPLSTTDSVLELNVGGCLILDNPGSSSFKNCGKDFEYLTECEHAACGTTCYGNSFTNYQACALSADSSQCLSEYNNVFGGSSPCASVVSSCFGGTTPVTQLQAVAAHFCE